MYKQADNVLYNPFLTKIPMPTFDLVITYTELLDNTCVEFPHTHTDYEIYYCLEGILNVKIENKLISLSAGHFVLIPPNLQHGSIYEPNTPKKYFVLVFHFNNHVNKNNRPSSFTFDACFINTLKDNLNNDQFYISKDENQCKDLIPKIQDELETKNFGWQLMIRNYYLSFIVRTFRNIITSPILYENNAEELNIAIEITKFMHNNYHKNISLKDVADAMFVTPRHISRIFNEYFGTSFAKTLSIYRLSYAKNYLCDTDYPIEKIATLVGFASPQSLYRLFKEREKMTIKEYRSLHSN